MSFHDRLRSMRPSVRRESTSRGSHDDFVAEMQPDAESLPSAIYLSGAEHDCSRRSLAMLRPAAMLRVKNGVAELLTTRGCEREENTDPFTLLAAVREGLTGIETERDATAAVACYVAYEAGRYIERLPAAAEDVLDLPDFVLLWPTRMLHFDHAAAQRSEYSIVWAMDGEQLQPLSENGISAHYADSAYSGPRKYAETAYSPASLPRRGFSREEYESAVRRVRQHIYDGDVYQVNLSQRFSFPLPQPAFSIWLRLFEQNPAPFYAWVNAGDHCVLSTSMERLFRLETADDKSVHIETRPIKGTRPRGQNDEDDSQQERALLASEKDDAELSMIVDLARNDLGRVCRTGTVRVREHRRIERYANVMHLVSIVEGTLSGEAGIDDVFRAVFPGGSITGCPKIRAMEIIDALEPETRHVYTGSVGLLEADGTADFNIAIRTAVVRSGICHLSVGGGIVFDSDPSDEYMETLHKGATFFNIAGVESGLEE
ncbi:anthranilate synthase component I family protein [bacterium]|nr:anthranilate synthase component I family protein [bacterium]